VLTGDKKETAVSIARSTSVIIPSSEIVYIDGGADSEFDHVIDRPPTTVAVIAPSALGFAIEERPTRLVDLRDHCRSVVCFRMLPSLKSHVGETVRNNTKKITMAIGDGANDVNMIQMAHQ
jgi:phospholipid-transporting ATPase